MFAGSQGDNPAMSIFNDMFGTSQDFSKTSQFSSSNDFNNPQSYGNQNMFTTVNYKNTSFGMNSFGQTGNTAPQNNNYQYNNSFGGGAATQKIQITGNEIDDLFS